MKIKLRLLTLTLCMVPFGLFACLNHYVEGMQKVTGNAQNILNADTLLNITYENGQLNSGITGVSGTVATAADAAYLVSPGRNGNYAIAHKVTLGIADYYSAGAYRSESDALDYQPALFFPGMERRYEFSVYLKDWEQWNSANPPYGDNIFQLKVTGGDPVPIRLLTKRNTVTVRYGESGNGTVITDFRPNINKWIDFRIDVKWTSDNTGYFKIYTKYEGETEYVLRFQQDNLQTYTGTQLGNGQKGYIKWGVYREAGNDGNGNLITSDNALTRIAYHDNIRIIQLTTQKTWTYDFGANTFGPVTSGLKTNISTGLPATQTDGGTPYLYAGDDIGGNIALVNSQNAGGSGAELKLTTPTSAPTNNNGYRYTIDGFYTPSTLMTVDFKLFIPSGQGASSALIMLGGGSSFSSANKAQPDVGQSLVYLRFMLNNGNIQYYTNNGTSNNYVTVTGKTITLGTAHKISIFANNGSSTNTYNFNNVQYSVPPQGFDVWVDGVLTASLTNTATTYTSSYNNLSAVAFGHHNSNGNGATYYIDDVVYSNYFNVSTLPVKLSKPLTAKVNGTSVQLNWATATEQNSDRFEIQHSATGTNFNKIGERATNAPMGTNYNFIHYNVPLGNNYYKLVQVDKDGKVEGFAPVVAHIALVPTDVKVTLGTGGVTVVLNSKKVIDNLKLSVVDINGKVLAKTVVKVQQGNNIFSIPVKLSGGLYLVHANGDTESWVKKVVGSGLSF